MHFLFSGLLQGPRRSETSEPEFPPSVEPQTGQGYVMSTWVLGGGGGHLGLPSAAQLLVPWGHLSYAPLRHKSCIETACSKLQHSLFVVRIVASYSKPNELQHVPQLDDNVLALSERPRFASARKRVTRDRLSPSVDGVAHGTSPLETTSHQSRFAFELFKQTS